MKHKEVLTTGEVARICHVAPRTVSKWFDTGKLRGYRIPGSRDRRIPRSQLLAFMRLHGMPLEGLEGNQIRVLIVDADAKASDAVAESLSKMGRYEVRVAASDFAAGMRAGNFGPHVVLVDVVSQQIDAAGILQDLRSNSNLAATKVLAVGGALTRGQRDSLLRQGFDGALSKPYAVDDLALAVEDATDLIT